jgi:hypothetical protein
MQQDNIVDTFPLFLEFWEKTKMLRLSFRSKDGQRNTWLNGPNCLENKWLIIRANKRIGKRWQVKISMHQYHRDLPQ